MQEMPIQEAHVAGTKEGIKEALLIEEETMEDFHESEPSTGFLDPNIL